MMKEKFSCYQEEKEELYIFSLRQTNHRCEHSGQVRIQKVKLNLTYPTKNQPFRIKQESKSFEVQHTNT